MKAAAQGLGQGQPKEAKKARSALAERRPGRHPDAPFAPYVARPVDDTAQSKKAAKRRMQRQEWRGRSRQHTAAGGSNTPQQQSDQAATTGRQHRPQAACRGCADVIEEHVHPLNCANHHECGAVNLRQSEFLITPLRLRDWKGDFWGHCFACSEYTDGNEFRKECKKRNRWRLKAVGCFRFREREVRFKNVLHQVEGELPGLSRSRIREIAVARSRAIAVAWSRGPSRAGDRGRARTPTPRRSPSGGGSAAQNVSTS